MADRSESLAPSRIVAAGTVVGVLDGLFAIVYFGLILHLGTAVQIFQNIARAVLGEAAFKGGLATAALGLVMHFGVAFAWSALYFVVLGASPTLRRKTRATPAALAVGVIFGAVVWLAMDLIILPLTREVPRPALLSNVFVAELIAHMVIVGPPIALLIRGRADNGRDARP